MNKLELNSTLSSFNLSEHQETLQSQPPQPQTEHDYQDHDVEKESTLRAEVEKSLRRYFQQIDDEPVTNLHQMVMSEVEAPLMEAIMRHTGNNQSKAATMLGLNRGTLRTKLKLYGLL